MKVIGFPIWSEFFRYEKAPAEFPAWKQEFVNKNIRLYQSNQKFIDQWLKKYNDLKDFTPTQRKMEWQAGTNIDSVWEGAPLRRQDQGAYLFSGPGGHRADSDHRQIQKKAYSGRISGSAKLSCEVYLQCQ